MTKNRMRKISEIFALIVVVAFLNSNTEIRCTDIIRINIHSSSLVEQFQVLNEEMRKYILFNHTNFSFSMLQEKPNHALLEFQLWMRQDIKLKTLWSLFHSAAFLSVYRMPFIIRNVLMLFLCTKTLKKEYEKHTKH